jgi:hypothetical protein
MTTLTLFAKDLSSFPIAWVSGADPDIRQKARDFLRSTMRIAFTGSVIFALYKGQALQQKLTIPTLRFSFAFVRLACSIEPLTLMTNGYLILTAESILRKSLYCLWMAGQIFGAFRLTPRFFSAAVRRETLRINPCLILSNLALNKIPEVQLGTGLYLFVVGAVQLSRFTSARWSMQEAPTDWALKGLLHMIFALDCLGHYDKYTRSLENNDARKNTFFYRVADKLEPVATWLATGQWPNAR